MRVLDLFAGCGGFSLGFKLAGFELAGGIEIKPEAARAYQRNLAPHLTMDDICQDIRHLDPRQFGSVDVIIGGPPCQAFSRIGRAKLRELRDCPRAHLTDPRAQLYSQYLDFVRALQPAALVMENVADMAVLGSKNVALEVCEALEAEGYRCAYTLLNAAHYGVPQTRERLILIGLRHDLGLEPTFPKPTHSCELPRGYREIRRGLARRLASDLELWETRFRLPQEAAPGLPTAVTARQALEDLPAFTLHLEGEYRSRDFQPPDPAPYATPAKHPYAALMREGSMGVFDSKMRGLPRDYKIFALMQPGDQYPEAYAITEALFQKELKRRRRAGEALEEWSPAYWELRKAIGPLYDPRKFPNRWRKMEADRPARTLMAHLGKDSYTHIHYDHTQARTITVREAARLQSFPDWFRFEGPMNPAFEQIGNAVPPLLARAIALQVRSQLSRALVPA